MPNPVKSTPVPGNTPGLKGVITNQIFKKKKKKLLPHIQQQERTGGFAGKSTTKLGSVLNYGRRG